MATEIPQFGTRAPGQHYVSRPSAYVVLRDPSDRIAVVRTPIGVFLPGGGQHPLETPEQAAIRETREECGLVIEIVGRIGVADQYVYSEPEDTFFAKRSTFLRAARVASAPSAEADHTLHWVAERDAEQLLTHPSHRWAITEDRQLGTES